MISASGAVAHDLWSNVDPQGPRLREGGGLGREARRGRDRRAGDRARAGRRRGVQRLRARRPRVLLRLERDVPGAAAGAVVARVQHHGRRRRHAQRPDLVDGADHPVEPGVARATTSPLGSLALDNPAIFCIPIGFLGCFLGTKLSYENAATSASTRSSTCARRPASAPRRPATATQPAPKRRAGGARAGAGRHVRGGRRRRAHARARRDPHHQPARRRGQGRVAGRRRGWRRPGSRSSRTSSPPGRTSLVARWGVSGDRPVAVPDRAPRHGAAGQGGLVGRPVLRRDRRRPPVRARDERHEGRDGGDRRRRRAGGGARAARRRPGSSSCCARARRRAARARWRWRAPTALLGRCGAVLVAEPTTNYPCVAHKGVVWADAVARGKTAHGSMPHLGENAIYKLARAVGAARGLRASRPTSTRCSALPTVSLGTFSGGININSVPDHATAGIDVRTVPGLRRRRRARRAARTARRRGRARAARHARPDRHRPGRRVGRRTVFAVMEPLIGETPEPRGLAYFTDAAALSPAYGDAADDHLRPRRRRAGAPHRRVVLDGRARGRGGGVLRDLAPLVRALGERRLDPRRRAQHRRLVEPDELHADRHPRRAGQPGHADRGHAEQRPRAAEQRVAGVALATAAAPRRARPGRAARRGLPAPPAARAAGVAERGARLGLGGRRPPARARGSSRIASESWSRCSRHSGSRLRATS